MAVYFSHFLFEAPLVSLLHPNPSAFITDTSLTQTHVYTCKHTALCTALLNNSTKIGSTNVPPNCFVCSVTSFTYSDETSLLVENVAVTAALSNAKSK